MTLAWEKHGNLLLLAVNDRKRAVIVREGSGYIGIGIIGGSLEERHDSNKKILKQRLVDLYRKEFPLPKRERKKVSA